MLEQISTSSGGDGSPELSSFLAVWYLFFALVIELARVEIQVLTCSDGLRI